MFVSSNALLDLKKHFLVSLIPLYDEREALNIFHLINDIKFNRSKIEISTGNIRCTESELLYWNSAIKRLKASEPVHHILGRTFFYDCEILVDKNTLVPRPETEELVHLILENNDSSPIKCLDVGTGSGCIPIALKKNRPNWSVEGIDISEKAIQLASKSATLNDVQVKFSHTDIFEYIPEAKSLDIIVSNPPYIPEIEKSQMDGNVVGFDPPEALFVSNDAPLVFYKSIGELGLKALKGGGKIYFEIHEEFGQEVLELLRLLNYGHCLLHQDLQGKDRMISAIKA